MNGESFSDLEGRGFVHVPGFLSPKELQFLRDDFVGAASTTLRDYSLQSVSEAAIDLVMPHVAEVLALVNQQTALRVDVPGGAAYFATGVANGVNFPWHQDHESYFAMQNHYDYLNFYIPIVKPEIEKSNLCLIPFDVLERESPKAHKFLVGNGATHFHPLGERSLAVSDETGTVRVLPSGMEPFCHTPTLAAGDLIVMRGDMIHRTQDTDTARVALSIRMASGSNVVTRSRLASGGVRKALLMSNLAQVFQTMFRAFDAANKDELPYRELRMTMDGLEPVEAPRRREFLKQLLKEKQRAGVLTSFALDAPEAIGLRGLATVQGRYRRYRDRGGV